VPGAVLTSPGCEAVTGADGRFRVQCEEGTRSFAVTHPDHLDRTWLVNAEGIGEHDVGVVELAGIPNGGGLWLAADGALDLLPQAPITLRATKDEQRWCMDGTAGEPVTVPPGRVRLLDNHTVDWRLYTLDADGCAYTMTRAGADHWTFAAERVAPAASTPRGPGRDWVELDLVPGDYALVEWYDGFLVRGPDGAWRGHWLRSARAVEPSALPPAGATTAGQAP